MSGLFVVRPGQAARPDTLVYLNRLPGSVARELVEGPAAEAAALECSLDTDAKDAAIGGALEKRERTARQRLVYAAFWLGMLLLAAGVVL